MYPMLIGLISLPILRRVIAAIRNRRAKVNSTSRHHCLKSIIILDAALCFLIAPDRILYALVVIGLLDPSGVAQPLRFVDLVAGDLYEDFEDGLHFFQFGP